eukprot:11302488-Alexandrium_andersonii.AAC.1
MTLHIARLRFTTSHHSEWLYTTSYRITSNLVRNTALDIVLRGIALHHTTLHYSALRCTPLHSTALHYTTYTERTCIQAYMHTCVHTCVTTYVQTDMHACIHEHLYA